MYAGFSDQWGDVCRGGAADGLRCAKSVGVVDHRCDGFADHGRGQGEVAAVGVGNRAAAGRPLVVQRAQAIGVSQGVGCGDDLALGEGAAQGDASGGGVVDVGYCRGCSAADVFPGPLEVGVTGSYADGFAYLGLGQGQS